LPIPQPDYRIHEINKRLQQRTDESDNLWWDAFATEFFEDDATLTLTFCLEDGPKRYSESESRNFVLNSPASYRNVTSRHQLANTEVGGGNTCSISPCV